MNRCELQDTWAAVATRVVQIEWHRQAGQSGQPSAGQLWATALCLLSVLLWRVLRSGQRKGRQCVNSTVPASLQSQPVKARALRCGTHSQCCNQHVQSWRTLKNPMSHPT